MKDKFKIILILLSIQLMSSSAFGNENTKSLSTSSFVQVPYYNDNHQLIETCSDKKAIFAQNYVSIGIDKLTVNKNDPLLKRIFNKDRRAFGASNLNAEYQSKPISISRVGNPVVINGKDSSIDMGVEWGMLDRVPWVLKNASIEIKLGYSADSTTDAMIQAFSGITSAIPDYTISTSLSTGFAITNAIDKLLFGSDRAIDLLNVHRDLPLFANRLCEGQYAIFSAENNNLYGKYYNGNVVWTGKDLEYNGKPIKDVSYAVVSVRVSDKYYDSVENSLNDNSRPWASKYREIQTSFFDFLMASNKNQLDDLTKNIKTNLLEARTLLSSDQNLIQREKNAIHQYIVDDFNNRLKLGLLRLDNNGNITVSSTKKVLTQSITSSNVLFDSQTTIMAERILQNPEANIPKVEPGFNDVFKNAIKGTQEILLIQ